jgi:hypothetical protein
MTGARRPLHGQVALVTVAETGAAVAMGARRTDRLDALAAKLPDGGARVPQLELDVTGEQVHATCFLHRRQARWSRDDGQDPRLERERRRRPRTARRRGRLPVPGIHALPDHPDRPREVRLQEGRWRVTTSAYLYEFRTLDNAKLCAMHWHPAGKSHATFPHLHLGPYPRRGRMRAVIRNPTPLPRNQLPSDCAAPGEGWAAGPSRRGRAAPYLWRGPGSIGPFILPPAATVHAGPETRSRWSAPLDERP